MLQLETQPFTCGRATYLDTLQNEPTSKVHVRVRIDDVMLTAQLDTGSPWCIVHRELALRQGLLTRDDLDRFDVRRLPETLLTRLGRVSGRLERKEIVLLADHGDSLAVEATIFASPAWSGPNFLGYSGCLERIRLALDPLRHHFYFGPAY